MTQKHKQQEHNQFRKVTKLKKSCAQSSFTGHHSHRHEHHFTGVDRASCRSYTVPRFAKFSCFLANALCTPADETCSNDLPGFQHGVVCCPLSCGQCGGSGCENIAGTEGASDCCSDVILTGGVMCDSTAVVPVVAPCVIGTGTADRVNGSVRGRTHLLLALAFNH